MDQQQFQSTAVLVVSTDSQETTRAWLPRFNAKYPGDVKFTPLSDPGHKVINRYGVFNPASAGQRFEVPHPSTYVIDRKGIVRWKDIETDYKIRPMNEQILEALSAVK